MSFPFLGCIWITFLPITSNPKLADALASGIPYYTDQILTWRLIIHPCAVNRGFLIKGQ